MLAQALSKLHPQHSSPGVPSPVLGLGLSLWSSLCEQLLPEALTDGIPCSAGNTGTRMKAIMECLCPRCSLVAALFSLEDEEETGDQVKCYLALQLSAHTHLHTFRENSSFSPVNPTEEIIIRF